MSPAGKRPTREERRDELERAELLTGHAARPMIAAGYERTRGKKEQAGLQNGGPLPEGGPKTRSHWIPL